MCARVRAGVACGVDRDLLLYDVLQTQHHAKLALHLLPVGSTFCQVAYGLRGRRKHLFIYCDKKEQLIQASPGIGGKYYTTT